MHPPCHLASVTAEACIRAARIKQFQGTAHQAAHVARTRCQGTRTAGPLLKCRNMRIAVISDVHGNLAALEAVLEAIAREGVDRLVVAGDVVVGAPDSLACWNLVRSLGYPLLRGNHERYLFDLNTEQAGPEWNSERFGPVQWASRRFDSGDLAAMRSLPLCLRLPEAPDLLIVHASPRSDRDAVTEDTSEEQLDEIFSGVSETLVVRGHNHLPAARVWGGRTVVTAGSVGLPLDGTTTAKYLLLEHEQGAWRYLRRETRYDVSETVARFLETGYLEEAGPMARLFMEELITARFKIMPFLRDYGRWSVDGSLSLSESVDRFLAHSAVTG